MNFKKDKENSEIRIEKDGHNVIVIGLFENYEEITSRVEESKVDSDKRFRSPYLLICKNNLRFGLCERDGLIQLDTSQLLDALGRIEYNISLCKESPSSLSVSFGGSVHVLGFYYLAFSFLV